MEPLTLKIIFIFVALLEAIILGLIPVYSTRFSESPKILGIANSFSGGVFLAIALMHIMPEQAGAWKEMSDSGDVTTKLPLPFFLMIAGYTLILIIDKVLFDTHVIFDDHGDEHGRGDVGGSIVVQRSIA